MTLQVLSTLNPIMRESKVGAGAEALQVLSMLNPIMRESKVGAGAEALLCLGSLPSFQIFGKPE